ncbi:ROK family protein [Candidatus Peribacteria bacterium]|jgi:predicted NBD/HSP70 family sugar kinase|nr:ROK family protein [Candidatus Peribacteria bacterium]MBT4020880.1 ROK family protein [Candidatus Peribacteria bacterium]MBT4241078.1 ROK family protein [Candidatus Peribacteria bacterium]MBT4474423.1 ROK family protein [Candidatus Peribacteria bacterium]
MPSIIGVDLGGTKIAVAKYKSDTFEIEDEKKMDTHAEQKFEHVLDDMIAIVNDLKDEDTVGLGVGVPGLVRHPEGKIVTLPNIPGADSFNLKDELASRLKIKVEVDNDANCFALAEAVSGIAKDDRVVVGITMGTGVGGGIVIDKKIYHGDSGYAAEIGHMLLKPGEPPYKTSDARGDVEQFFSGTAMGKRCTEASRPEDYLEGKVCSFLQPEIFREVAWMCVNIVHLLDPSVIVFGGSAGRALEPHLDEILRELKQWLLPGTPLPKLAIAKLKDAGTMGAAMLLI